jgi:radical SAM superfamily enzyme YgiQ (UPF0313 family)
VHFTHDLDAVWSWAAPTLPLLPEPLRCDAVDAVVIGEGEASFRELMEAIGTDSPVPGTLLRASTGEILEGGSRALIDQLDSLPVPAFRVSTTWSTITLLH